MPATLFNAPVSPLLTRTVILILSILLLLAAVALVSMIGRSDARPDASAADRPAFTRRMEPDR